MFRGVAKIYDVAQPLFLITLGGGQVQDVVGVDVFFIEAIVVHGAIRFRIAKNLQQPIAAAAGGGDRDRKERRRLSLNRIDLDDQIVNHVSRKPVVILRDVERAGKGIALAVERIQSLDLFSPVGSVE